MRRQEVLRKHEYSEQDKASAASAAKKRLSLKGLATAAAPEAAPAPADSSATKEVKDEKQEWLAYWQQFSKRQAVRQNDVFLQLFKTSMADEDDQIRECKRLANVEAVRAAAKAR